MASNLIVPINIQVLCIGNKDAEKRCFRRSSVNFANLPLPQSTKDSRNQPNISEEILTQPFVSDTRRRKGIYLHWALPNALTKGYVRSSQTDNGLNFPIVPNRWLITRLVFDKDKNIMSNKGMSWIVESDYLHNQKDPDPLTITVPLQASEENSFSSLGKKTPLKDWKENTYAKRYNKLTAIGYGNLTFASFYPDCSSVFGLYDNLDGIDEVDITYSVIGWHSDPKDGLLENLLKNLDLEGSKNYNTSDLLTKLQWNIGYSLRLMLENPSPENLEKIKPGELGIFAKGGELYCKAHGQKKEIRIAKSSNPKDGLSSDIVERILKAVKANQNIEQKDKEALFQYTLTTKAIDRILCSGIIRSVKWNANCEYLKDDDIKVNSVVLASNELEALTAFLVRDATDKEGEHAFNFCQMGILKDAHSCKDHIVNSQALHSKRFQQIDGGKLWNINIIKNEEGVPGIILPEAVNEKLLELNRTQQEYDNLNNVRESMRWRIFTLWHKYLKSRYHDYPVPEYYIKAYILLKGELKNYQKINNEIEINKKIEKQKNELDKLLEGLNKQKKYQYNRVSVPAPKYYTSYDPAVLIGNDDPNNPWKYAGERNKVLEGGQQRPLKCRLSEQLVTRGDIDSPIKEEKSNLPEAIRNNIIELLKEAVLWSQDADGFRRSFESELEQESISNQQWDPKTCFLHHLEWEISYYPLKLREYDKEIDDYPYTKNFVKDTFNLNDDSSELTLKEDKSPFVEKPQTYTGYALLTPNAKFNLHHRIKEYEALGFHLDDKTLYNKVLNMSVLSQNLNGFNQALLMQKKEPQLPINDPFASALDKNFIDNVKKAMKDMPTTTPLPENKFNPIQDGAVVIKRIRLVDSFGRFKEIAEEDIGDSMIFSSEVKPVFLRDKIGIKLFTRIIPNSRLSFRLLTAYDKTQETNFHPSTNPICGWILLNNIDNSLMLYDQEGNAIGSLVAVKSKEQGDVIWKSAPGLYAFNTDFEQTFNEAFKKITEDKKKEGALEVLKELAGVLYGKDEKSSTERKKKYDAFKSFLASMDNTLSHMEPKGYASSFSNLHLFGTPLAIVQANTKLELQGLPAVNLSWKALSHDAQANNRFTDVEFPIRLGNYHDFEDGVMGYFSGTCDDINYEKFYAVFGEKELDGNFVAKQNLTLSPCYYNAEKPEDEKNKTKNLLLFLDPRGTITIKSGILPTKQIKIPESLYLPALQNIYVTFLTAPVITDSLEEQMIISVSKEEGMQWSWVEAPGEDVQEKAKQEKIKAPWKEKNIPQEGSGIFSHTQKISEGWLKLHKTQ